MLVNRTRPLHVCRDIHLVADGFIWLDGSNSQYRKWAPGEPNGPGSENCVEIFSTQYPGMWNDQRCEYYDYMYRRYVCKAKKGKDGEVIDRCFHFFIQML